MNQTQLEIVVIESSEEDARHIISTLRSGRVGNDVRIVKSEAEAFDLLFGTGPYANQKLPDLPKLILLNLNLPGASGLDVLRQLRSDERTKSIPVVMLTDSQEERGVMQSYKLGAQGCIVKPFDCVKFREAIAELGLTWLLVSSSPSEPEA